MIGVTITPLRKIETINGDVFHALKRTESSFSDFGEAYFSFVKQGKVKGWKKHERMQLNLVVPIGEVLFVIYDDRQDSATKGEFMDVIIGPTINYSRLTIAPGLWIAFKGMGNENCLLNIANIEHDPMEAISQDLNIIEYAW